MSFFMRPLFLATAVLFFAKVYADPLLEKSCRETFERLISQAEIQKKVQEAAQKIDAMYNGEEVTMVILMKGAICIGADLMRALSTTCTLEYIQTCSYGKKGSERGELVILGLDKLQLEGKNVLLVDDIFDSGVTLATVAQKLSELKPKSLRSLVLLSKNVPHKTDYRPDYTLFEVEDRFIVGYGMDYKEHWRHLPEVCAVK